MAHPSKRSLTAGAPLALLALVVAARVVAAEPASTTGAGARAASQVSQEAPPRPTLDGKRAAALHACTTRADLLFVRKCVQACMIDSKTRTRVMQESFDREICQQRCGHQQELPTFVDACMRRAGFADAS